MKHILTIFFLGFVFLCHAQKSFNINLQSPDSRLQISAEIEYAEHAPWGLTLDKQKGICLTLQQIHFKVHNNTNHDLGYVIYYTIIGLDGNSKEGHLGYIANDGFLGDHFAGKNSDSNDEYTPDNYGSKISYEAGINPHHINQVKDIRINSIKIKDYTDIENKKQEETKKQEDAKKQEETKNQGETSAQGENTKNESDKVISENKTGSVSSQSTSNQQTSSGKSQEQLDYEAEQVANQARQNEYDTWKSNAIQERANYDAAATASTASILLVLGGFIYKNMGRVPEPKMVFEPAIKKKAKPRFFMNGQLGYSYSSIPFLYESKITSISGGKTTTKYSYKGYDGSFINLGGSANLGFTSNYYSFYGSFGIIGGIVPNFRGSYFGNSYGGGIALGSKPIKVYARYKKNDSSEYNLKSGDIEEENSIQTKLTSVEYEAGLQFTFGGKASSDYKRTHLYVGLLQKEIVLENGIYGFEAIYFPDQGIIHRIGKATIKGYSFEFRKDHSGDFFLRYYPEHNYFGDVGSYNSANGSLPAKLEHPTNSYIEIGFYRCLDFFN